MAVKKRDNLQQPLNELLKDIDPEQLMITDYDVDDSYYDTKEYEESGLPMRPLQLDDFRIEELSVPFAYNHKLKQYGHFIYLVFEQDIVYPESSGVCITCQPYSFNCYIEIKETYRVDDSGQIVQV